MFELYAQHIFYRVYKLWNLELNLFFQVEDKAESNETFGV